MSAHILVYSLLTTQIYIMWSTQVNVFGHWLIGTYTGKVGDIPKRENIYFEYTREPRKQNVIEVSEMFRLET